jgi:hypothetical protein
MTMPDDLPPETRNAYAIFVGTTTLDKKGAPYLGTRGVSTDRVIVIRSAVWRRLVADHPSLASANFNVGELDG